MRGRLAVWAVLAGATVAAQAAAATEAPVVDLRPVLEDGELATETFTTVALLDDGTYIILQLYFSNFGFGDHHGACRLLVVQPDGSAWRDAKKVDDDEWRVETSGERALRVDRCKLVASPAHEMTVRLPTGFVRVRLHKATARHRPPNRRYQGDGDFYEHEISVPWSRASVELGRRGSTPRTGEGYGYADRSRAEALPLDLARMWIRFRGGSADGDGALVWARFPADGSEALGYRWSAASARAHATDSVEAKPLATDAAAGWQIAAAGAGGNWSVKTVKLLYRFAPMEEFGLLGRLARPVIGNPVTYTFRATVTRNGSDVPLPGLLEVAFDE